MHTHTCTCTHIQVFQSNLLERLLLQLLWQRSSRRASSLPAENADLYQHVNSKTSEFNLWNEKHITPRTQSYHRGPCSRDSSAVGHLADWSHEWMNVQVTDVSDVDVVEMETCCSQEKNLEQQIHLEKQQWWRKYSNILLLQNILDIKVRH